MENETDDLPMTEGMAETVDEAIEEAMDDLPSIQDLVDRQQADIEEDATVTSSLVRAE